MHSELHHANIICLYCAWKDPQYIYVAVEWAPNGDLFSVLKSWGASGVAESVVVTSVRPAPRRRCPRPAITVPLQPLDCAMCHSLVMPKRRCRSSGRCSLRSPSFTSAASSIAI